MQKLFRRIAGNFFTFFANLLKKCYKTLNAGFTIIVFPYAMEFFSFIFFFLVSQAGERKSATWVGRMAVSRAESRWSKEPRMATMLSVIVWLFCSDSLMNTALSLRACIACGTPIYFLFSPDFPSLCFCLSLCLVREKMQMKNEKKLRIRDLNVKCVPVSVAFGCLVEIEGTKVVITDLLRCSVSGRVGLVCFAFCFA